MRCRRAENGTLNYCSFDVVEVLDQTYDCPYCGETLCASEEEAKRILENRLEEE